MLGVDRRLSHPGVAPSRPWQENPGPRVECGLGGGRLSQAGASKGPCQAAVLTGTLPTQPAVRQEEMGGPPGPGSPGAASGGASASCRPPPAAPEPHPALALGAPTLLEGLGDESHSGSAPGLGPWDPQLSTTATSSAAAWPAGPAPVPRRGRQGPHQARRQLAFHSGVAVRSVPPAPAPVAAASPSLGSRGLLSSHGPGSSIRGLRLCRRPRSGPAPAPRPCDLVARGDAPFHVVTAGRTRRRKPASATRALTARARVCLFRKQRSFRKLCRLRQRILGSSLSLTSKRT